MMGGRERAVTCIENVPIQLAQCWFLGLAISSTTWFTNSTRKLLWFELSEMLIAVLKKNKFIVLFIVIFGTVIPYCI